MSASKSKKTSARSAKTGRKVTKAYAKRHPATTVVEGDGVWSLKVARALRKLYELYFILHANEKIDAELVERLCKADRTLIDEISSQAWIARARSRKGLK